MMATIMTDPDFADATYVEPLTWGWIGAVYGWNEQRLTAIAWPHPKSARSSPASHRPATPN